MKIAVIGGSSTNKPGLVSGLAAYCDHLPLDDPDNQPGLLKHLVEQLPAGITHLLMLPEFDTPELPAITPDWPSRVVNYDVFASPYPRNT